jgi:hypothetical protein
MRDLPDVRNAWAAFLNPDVVRAKLLSAGLFLVGFEMLLDSIKGRPRSFFADRWTVDGPVPGPEYEREVLSLDPKGKNDALRGSTAWLRAMGVIDDSDELRIREVTDARNNIAHEMTKLVANSEIPDFTLHYPKLIGLLSKIENWWILNLEIPTNPDWDGQDVTEADIVSGPAWTMSIMAKVALGEGDEAWALHRQFEKVWPPNESR